MIEKSSLITVSAKLINSYMWHENMIIQHRFISFISFIYRYKLKHTLLHFIIQVNSNCFYLEYPSLSLFFKDVPDGMHYMVDTFSNVEHTGRWGGAHWTWSVGVGGCLWNLAWLCVFVVVPDSAGDSSPNTAPVFALALTPNLLHAGHMATR